MFSHDRTDCASRRTYERNLLHPARLTIFAAVNTFAERQCDRIATLFGHQHAKNCAWPGHFYLGSQRSCPCVNSWHGISCSRSFFGPERLAITSMCRKCVSQWKRFQFDRDASECYVYEDYGVGYVAEHGPREPLSERDIDAGLNSSLLQATVVGCWWQGEVSEENRCHSSVAPRPPGSSWWHLGRRDMSNHGIKSRRKFRSS